MCCTGIVFGVFGLYVVGIRLKPNLKNGKAHIFKFQKVQSSRAGAIRQQRYQLDDERCSIHHPQAFCR